MNGTPTGDIRAEFGCFRTEPFGSPSASSEVSRIANFYRVECLTVFGTGRCESEQRAEASGFELKAAA